MDGVDRQNKTFLFDLSNKDLYVLVVESIDCLVVIDSVEDRRGILEGLAVNNGEVSIRESRGVAVKEHFGLREKVGGLVESESKYLIN